MRQTFTHVNGSVEQKDEISHRKIRFICYIRISFGWPSVKLDRLLLSPLKAGNYWVVHLRFFQLATCKNGMPLFRPLKQDMTVAAVMLGVKVCAHVCLWKVSRCQSQYVLYSDTIQFHSVHKAIRLTAERGHRHYMLDNAAAFVINNVQNQTFLLTIFQ